jgi:DNA replication protein DnaC
MYDLNKVSPTVRHMIMRANLPMKTIGMELSDLDPTPAIEKVETWVSTVESGRVIKSPGSPAAGLGLLLIGEPGHGKTTMAAIALQRLIRGMSIPGAFYDYPKLIRLEKESWDDEDAKVLMKQIYGDSKDSIPLLVLDDLGKKYRTQSGFAENHFDALLRSRFNAGLPTIITTNVALNRWRSTYGSAMESFCP